jgi:demethylphylloquinol methyltransferase
MANKSYSSDAETPAAEDIQALFNRIAPVYDRVNGLMSWGRHLAWKKMAVGWAVPPAGGDVLDVCCGTGDLARLLARRTGPRGKIFGLDFSEQMLACARRSTYEPLQSQIDWVQGDALALPFGDQTFDAATMSFGLRNLTDIPKAFQELHRVLKPSAKAVVLDLNRTDNPDQERFQQWYLNTVVPQLGRWLKLEAEYTYIAPSLERFPKGPEQVQIARAQGFKRAIHRTVEQGAIGFLILEA